MHANVTKKLTANLPFGQNSVARITVTRFDLPVELDGDRVGQQTEVTTKVEIYKGDRLLDSGSHATINHYEDAWSDGRTWDANKIDHAIPITQVGNKALAIGDFGTDIKTAIEAMSQELLHEVGQVTKAEKQQAQTIAKAKAVVTAAEAEGINRLLPAKKLADWRTNYNALHNEGGEGYIPQRVSRESYEAAQAVLAATLHPSKEGL